MTAEEKRERLLKRMLPALGITIIYFIFVSDIMVDQKTKAQDDYLELARKGISRDVIPSINSQNKRMGTEIGTLQEEQTAHKNKIKEMATFVDKAEASTESATLLATILAENGVRVVKDQDRVIDVEALTPALKEIKLLLLPNKPIKAQHLELRANYMSMYAALRQMKEKKLQAVPVLFTMVSPEDTKGFRPGELKWELDLWI